MAERFAVVILIVLRLITSTGVLFSSSRMGDHTTSGVVYAFIYTVHTYLAKYL